MNETKLREMLGFRLGPSWVDQLVEVAKKSPVWFFNELIGYPKCGPQFATAVMRDVWGAAPSDKARAILAAACREHRTWDPDAHDDPVNEIVASILKRLA